MKLLDNILRFENHYKGTSKLKNEDISNYFTYNTMAMECFQAVNALIEIGEYIVTKNKIGFPSTYNQIFELLFKEKVIYSDELKVFKRLVYLRNLISHEYYKISEDELLEMANLLDKVKEFVDRIKKELNI